MREEVVRSQETKIRFQGNCLEMEAKENQITKVLHMVDNLSIKIIRGDILVIQRLIIRMTITTIRIRIL